MSSCLCFNLFRLRSFDVVIFLVDYENELKIIFSNFSLDKAKFCRNEGQKHSQSKCRRFQVNSSQKLNDSKFEKKSISKLRLFRSYRLKITVFEVRGPLIRNHTLFSVTFSLNLWTNLIRSF